MTTRPNLDVDELVNTSRTLIDEAGAWALSGGRDWTFWIVAAVAVFLGLRFVRALIAGTLKTNKAPEFAVRNIVGAIVTNTKQLFLLAVSFFVTAPFLIDLPDDKRAVMTTAVTILAVIQVLIWLRIVFTRVIEGVLTRNQSDERSAASLRALLGLFVNIGLVAIGGVMILNNLGMDASALLAGLGVGGIAIGLAAQSIFSDLFAGMSIMLDRPFVRGDVITFKGFTGTVENVGLKTTRLKALTGEQLVVTNSSLLGNEIQNYKVMNERRNLFRLGVTYQTPHAILASLPGKMREVIETRPRCRFDRCHLAAYGDSAIIFECVYFVLTPEYIDHMDEQQAVFLAIHKLFEDIGAEFAYPTQTVFVENVAR